MPEPTASSSAHSKVTPGWSEVKVNVASWLSVGSVGEPVIVVSGSGSIVQRWEAGVGSVLAEFTARTSSSCWPTARPVRTYGDSSDSQEPQSSVTPSGRSSPSRLHSKVATESFEENVKLASRLLVPDGGPDWIVVSGTAVAVPVAMAKAEKLSTSAQTTPASVSLVVVTSVQAVPSWCSRRT